MYLLPRVPAQKSLWAVMTRINILFHKKLISVLESKDLLKMVYPSVFHSCGLSPSSGRNADHYLSIRLLFSFISRGLSFSKWVVSISAVRHQRIDYSALKLKSTVMTDLRRPIPIVSATEKMIIIG